MVDTLKKTLHTLMKIERMDLERNVFERGMLHG